MDLLASTLTQSTLTPSHSLSGHTLSSLWIHSSACELAARSHSVSTTRTPHFHPHPSPPYLSTRSPEFAVLDSGRKGTPPNSTALKNILSLCECTRNQKDFGWVNELVFSRFPQSNSTWSSWHSSLSIFSLFSFGFWPIHWKRGEIMCPERPVSNIIHDQEK